MVRFPSWARGLAESRRTYIERPDDESLLTEIMQACADCASRSPTRFAGG